MPFQVIVREIKQTAELGHPATTSGDQIYEQTVDVLDLSKVLAAVNFKPRVRKPRTSGAAKT